MAAITPDANKTLYRWCRANRLFRSQTQEEAPKPTHNILNAFAGGILIVPQTREMHRDFIIKYMEGVALNEVYYLSENRPDVFPMFLDLDIKTYNAEMTQSTLLGYLGIIHMAVCRFFGSIPPSDQCLDMVVLTADVAIKAGTDADPRSVYKSGVHVIWPYMPVTQKMALIMRETIVCCLKAKYGELEGIQNSWDDIVDAAVFTSSGLRMPYSHKCSTCPSCHGNDTDNCDVCAYTLTGKPGKVSDGRPYTPKYYLVNGDANDKAFATFTANATKAMLKMSIRQYAGGVATDRWQIYEGAPIPAQVSAIPKATVVSEDGRVEYADDVSGIKRQTKKGVEISRTDPRFDAVQKCIRQFTEPMWSELIVSGVYRRESGGKSSYLVTVRGLNDKWCLNKNSTHASNRVYFIINDYKDHAGIVQRCFSSKTTIENRLHGPCSKFNSDVYKIPTDYRVILFCSDRGLAEDIFKGRDRPGVLRGDGTIHGIVLHYMGVLAESLDSDNEADQTSSKRMKRASEHARQPGDARRPDDESPSPKRARTK